MNDYISRDVAICIADYAVDEHPYDKDPAKPETYSDYNQGWNDACDFIRERLENAGKSDVAPVRHGHWIDCEDEYSSYVRCSVCGDEFTCWEADCAHTDFCPNCGAKMDVGAGNALHHRHSGLSGRSSRPHSGHGMGL